MRTIYNKSYKGVETAKIMRCDIIIPVWNQRECTERCINSIRDNTKYPYRLILIDNGSDADAREYLATLAKEDRRVELIRNEENLGFIKATNQGLKLSNAPYSCLMNNDAEATVGWLTELISVAESDRAIGLVNPQSKRGNSREKGARYLETNQCMGYCMIIKREVLDKIGYLDEAFGVGGFDDTDFSRRADLAGYKCVCARNAYVYHEWHTSFNKAGNREALVRKNEAIYFEKWGKYLRIGYPISSHGDDEFYTDMNISLGLAKEWNWVHAWISSNAIFNKNRDFFRSVEHQSLRAFPMSGNRLVFYAEVIFKLVERRLKGRKLFDVVLVSDKKLFNVLTVFKRFFSFPVFYIEKSDLRHGKGSEAWRNKAKDIVGEVKRGSQI